MLSEEDTDEDSTQDSLLTPLEKRIRYGTKTPSTPREASAQWKRRQAMPVSSIKPKSPKHKGATAHQVAEEAKEYQARDEDEEKEEEERPHGKGEAPVTSAAKKIASIGASINPRFAIDPPPIIKPEPGIPSDPAIEWEQELRRRIDHARVRESQPIMQFLGIVALHASVSVAELLDESIPNGAELNLKELLMALIRGGPDSNTLYYALSRAMNGNEEFLGSPDATAWLRSQMIKSADATVFHPSASQGSVIPEYIVIKPTVRGAIDTVMMEAGKDGAWALRLIVAENKASVLLAKAAGLLLKKNQLFAIGSRYTNNRGIMGAKIVNLSANQNLAIDALYRNAVFDLQIELGTYPDSTRSAYRSGTRTNLRILSRRRL